jgi:hypothetical protein
VTEKAVSKASCQCLAGSKGKHNHDTVQRAQYNTYELWSYEWSVFSQSANQLSHVFSLSHLHPFFTLCSPAIPAPPRCDCKLYS